MKRLSYLLIMLLLLAACVSHPGENAATYETTGSMAPAKTLPVDPDVKIGKLSNGLTYYVRANPKPENRLELRLVVNVGSVLEDDDQTGLAHFCEHMAFNGTEHFEKNELINFLESVGMRFGADLNAYTSFDETVYMLQLPTENDSILNLGFQVLEDWAHNLSFLDEEIDKERGVIHEEWRLGRGARGRMSDLQYPILFHESKYASRLPIGKMEVVDNFEHDVLRRFYNTWYRPELMAVIAVGDYDQDKLEQLVRQYFGKIKNPKDSQKREYFDMPDHQETLYAIAADKEATSSSVSVYFKHPVEKSVSLNDYRNSLIENLYNSMFNARLRELNQQADPPFIYAGSSSGNFIRTKDMYILRAAVKDNGIPRGLEVLMTEAKRVRQYGFTGTELERHKTQLLRNIETSYLEQDKTNSSTYVDEYTRNFLDTEPIPGIKFEYETCQELIPGITLAEVNQVATRLLSDGNRVVLVNSPEKEGVTVPTEAELDAVFAAVKSKSIEAYKEEVDNAPLVANPPKPGKVVKEKKIDALGVVEWTLSNNIKVVLKETNFKNDQILFSSYSPGGYSLAADQDFIAASTATSVIMQSGLGSFDKIQLDKKLTGKMLKVSPSIGEVTEQIAGSASPSDLETMFQLIYLYFTAPGKNAESFQAYKSRLQAYIANKNLDPNAAFEDTLEVTLADHHFRSRPWTPAILEEMDLEKSWQFYSERFADAGDFTFFFVGNFETKALQPLVEKWLGSLPNLNRGDQWKDHNIDPPKGHVVKTVNKGVDPKSSVALVYSGETPYTNENRWRLNSTADVLRIMLREDVREAKSGTYGIQISSIANHYPDEEYQISIIFGCDPERVEELIAAVKEQIKLLQQQGPSQENVDKVKENYLRMRETNLKENKYWLSKLRNYYLNNEDPLDFLTYDKDVASITRASIQKAAQQYLADNLVEVILKPEK